MLKASPSSRSIDINVDKESVERAFAHYNLPPVEPPKKPTGSSSQGLQQHEEVLLNVSAILQSAAATAYEQADNQSGSSRTLAMAVFHLIEMAQGLLDPVLDECSST